MFIYFWEKETEDEQGRGRERGRHRIRSRLQAVSTEPAAGLELMSCEIMTWAKVRRLTDWATQVPHLATYCVTVGKLLTLSEMQCFQL